MSSTTDSITHWMNAAGRKPMLPKHEFDLIAKQIQLLPVDHPKRVKLINKLVEHNLKLVVRFVARFMKSKSAKQWGGEETLDYLQVGVLGLRRAIEKYDPTRGYCFSTYAQHWLRSFVGRYNYWEMSVINIPESSCRAAFSYKKYGKSVGSCSFKEHNAPTLTRMVFAAANVDSLDRQITDSISLIDVIDEGIQDTNNNDVNVFGPDIEMLFDKAELSDEDRTVLEYRYIYDMTFAEMSNILGQDQRALCSRCANARKRLRNSIEPGTVCL